MDFVCIGAPRSGTTWLYSRLSELPDFKLPVRKELHYFDRDKRYPSPSHLSEPKLAKRLFNPMWLAKALKDSSESLLKRDFDAFAWKKNWYFSDYDDDWYMSLFNTQKITGDITPAYSILEDGDVEKLAKLLPDVKIVYMLRNPIERTWSSYRKNYLRRNRTLSIDEIIAMCNRDGIKRRGAYTANLERYLKYFDKSQFIIGFYDAISNDALGLMEDIVTFLGGDSAQVKNHCKLKSRNNISPEEKIPEEIMIHLEKQYEGEISNISSRVGSFSNNWILDKGMTQQQEISYSPTVML